MAIKRKTKKDPPKDDTQKSDVKKTSGKRSINHNFDKIAHKLNSLKKKRYFPFLVILLIIISVFYFSRGLFFAAMVDGKPISRIKLISELEKQGGEQTLDSLISMELIAREAKRTGVGITDLEISSEINVIKEYLEAQGTTLDFYLSMQGQTMDSLTDNIRLQKTVEKLVSENIKVSEEEIMEFFEANKEFYGEDVQYEDVKESIRDELAQQKLGSEFQTLLQRLKEEGNIIYFVDF